MRSVLVVDDSAPFRKQVRRMFEAAGYRVVAEAATGAAGITEASRTDAAIVLVDVGLPDMSGFEVVDHIDASRAVLVSGRDPRTFATALESTRAAGFVAKEHLSVASIEAVLDQR